MYNVFSKPPIRVLTAVLCTLLWGSAYPLIKLGYEKMDIVTIPDKLMFAGVRYVAAGLMLFVFLLVFSGRSLVIEKSRISLVVLYGLVQTGFMYFLNYMGLSYTTATKTSVLTALSAFLAVVLSPLFFKNEKITFLKIIGCLIGIGGVMIVNMGFLSGSFSFTGEGLIIIAMILNTFGGFIGKTAGRGNPFGASTYQLFIGGTFLCIIAFIFGSRLRFNYEGMLITLFLALVSSGAFSLWCVLLTCNDASKIMVFNLLIPLFGALFSFLILGEREIFDPLYIVSLIMISTGIILVNYEKKPEF